MNIKQTIINCKRNLNTRSAYLSLITQYEEEYKNSFSKDCIVVIWENLWKIIFKFEQPNKVLSVLRNAMPEDVKYIEYDFDISKHTNLNTYYAQVVSLISAIRLLSVSEIKTYLEIDLNVEMY